MKQTTNKKRVLTSWNCPVELSTLCNDNDWSAVFNSVPIRMRRNEEMRNIVKRLVTQSKSLHCGDTIIYGSFFDSRTMSVNQQRATAMLAMFKPDRKRRKWSFVDKINRSEYWLTFWLPYTVEDFKNISSETYTKHTGITV
jgi:hypothetical protein